MTLTRDVPMRPSRVLRKMRAGGVAISGKANLNDPRVIEIMGYSGYDCLWICREHVPTNWETMEHQVRTAKMWDMDTVIRVSRGDYSDMILPLEMDATAIMVPHVFTAAEAQQIGRMTKFHPVGRRPWDGGNNDGRWCTIPPAQYMELANRERFVIVQIEDPEALNELDGIAAAPGVDMLLFGPGDFSHGIGVPGQMSDPRIEDARRKIAASARRHGKFAGTVSGPADVQRLADMGYQFINVGADVIALVEYFGKMVSAVTGIKPAAGASVYDGSKA